MKFVLNRAGFYLGGRLISTFEAKCEWMKWRQLRKRENYWNKLSERLSKEYWEKSADERVIVN